MIYHVIASLREAILNMEDAIASPSARNDMEN